MSELALSPATNAPAEVSVSELSQRLKRTIEDAYGFVRVRGEISGFRGVHGSGHAYFALKDEGAKIDAVVWRSAWAKLRFKPEEGLEVVATGKLTTYPGKSAYQLVIETLEPAGAGALMALLEQRRKALAKEGLFDAARKRPLPYLPEVIGVITSPTGAVIRDILHRLADRFPRRVIVWPVRVQGETSAAEVAAAIAGFNALAAGGKIPRPDVLIVARGGGSLEDLWSFNEEIVVRAAAASRIPLISAVGHETDTTLIDHAADRRAPTPTAAAEMAVPVRAELLEAVRSRGGRLDACAKRGLERARNELRGLARALPGGDALLAMPRQRTDHAGSRLQPALVAGLREARLRFSRVPFAPSLLRARLVKAAGSVAALEARAERALRQASGRARSRLDRCAGRLEPALAADVRLHRSRFEKVAGRASPARIADAARRYRGRIGELDARLSQTAIRALDRCRDELSRLEALIEALSYVNVLKRGFALVRDAADRPVRSSQGIRPGTPLDIEFADGRVKVNAEGAPRPRGRGSKPPLPGQGSLF